MATAEANAFYGSVEWQRTREAYKKFRKGLCEKCLAKGLYSPGEIVHHKIHVTAETLDNPEILTGFDNLELLCRKCHAEEHGGRVMRYEVDPMGRVCPLGR